MTDKELKQFIDNLKNKLGSVSENLSDYVKEGEDCVGRGEFDKATAVYELATQYAPDNKSIIKKRHYALANSLGIKKAKRKGK